MVDEADRSLHDALSVLSQTGKETRIVLGGGCSEMLMSCAVEEEARRITGKKAIAAESFARALRQIPTILADNAGYDSSDLVTKLRAAHYEGRSDAGLGELNQVLLCRGGILIEVTDMNEGKIGSMKKLGVTESYKLKRQVILSASEAAEMILRFVFPRCIFSSCSPWLPLGWMIFCARRTAKGSSITTFLLESHIIPKYSCIGTSINPCGYRKRCLGGLSDSLSSSTDTSRANTNAGAMNSLTTFTDA